MKLNQHYHIRYQKLMPSETTVAAEDVETADAGAEVEAREEPRHLQELLGHPGQVQSIQTCPQETGTGATCTENSGVVHISVQNQVPARGKMSSLPNHQNNDRLTSSATLK